MTFMIRDLVELEKVLEEKARATMEGASRDILKLFKEYVLEYVYDHTPRDNGSFIELWDWSEIEKRSNTLVMEMFHDWGEMAEPDPRATYPFRHTTFMTEGWDDDARPFLAETFDGTKFKNWEYSGDRLGGYWTKFIEQELNSGGIKKIIDKHARKNGLNPSGFSVGL